MRATCWLSAAVSGLALALWAMPAAPAPISGATTSLKVAADGTSIVEATHWRRRHAYYYGGYSPYYYSQPRYRYSYSYPSYAYYYAYPRYGYYGHRHHQHHHYRHYHGW